jgi:type I restriction enzyme, S subunit
VSHYRTYPAYKDSGVEWLGRVPEHWIVCRLGFRMDTIVPMRDKPKDLTGEIPWVRIEDFDGKFIAGSTSNQGVDFQTVSEMNLKVFPAGTVLCSCSCNMGRTAIAAIPLVSNQTFIGLIPQRGIISEFGYYLMQAASEELTSQGTGAIQQYLSRDDFRALRLPFPGVNVQHLIVCFLDRETARIDALIEKKQRLIELLKEKR